MSCVMIMAVINFCNDSAHCKTRVKVEQTCVSEYGKVDCAVFINQGAV